MKADEETGSELRLISFSDRRRRIVIRNAALMVLFGLVLLGACNQAKESVDTGTRAATARPADIPAMDVKSSPSEPQARTMLTLASGEEVSVLSVGEFEQKLSGLSGLVAIAGRVKEAYPERGALILVDCANMAGCGDGCCPQAEVPVRMALSEYEGSLPAVDCDVIVVGDLTVRDAGYELAVREIRQGEEILISKAA